MSRICKLNDMLRGWIVGDFEPSVLRTGDFEVGIRSYKTGDQEDSHLHKLATEITAVVSGEIIMRGSILVAGDIIVMEPGEATSFEAKADSVVVIIKTPSVMNDKFESKIDLLER